MPYTEPITEQAKVYYCVIGHYVRYSKADSSHE
jgi:hypothetical protein